MSKKVIVLSIAVLFGAQAGLAMAANPDTGPGCGLRKLVWADAKGQKEIAPQVMMATTNGIGMNTFAISPAPPAVPMMAKSCVSITLLCLHR